MVGSDINGSDPKWKVYSRNWRCKKEVGPKETNGPKEIMKIITYNIRGLGRG